MKTALLVTAAWFTAFAQSPDDRLNATLWSQSAEEYRGAALMAFRAAGNLLPLALADTGWTAAIEQTVDARKLPPAVVLDIDETVLDNSPFQVRMIRAGALFQPAAWDLWVAEAAAGAVPGAAEFCRTAAALNVTVFYISNRDQKLEKATRENLAKMGFPLVEGVDTVLLRGERAEWSSDKGTRRAHVAAKYRIAMLVGDDLGDFLSNVRTALAGRRTLAAQYEDRWGARWFMIPNPTYGSWEDVVAGTGDMADRTRRKLEALK